MTIYETPATAQKPIPGPLFGSILCGISGSRHDGDVIEQAAALAGSQARLTFVAVTWEIGFGQAAQAHLTRHHAQQALGRAHARARQAGVDAATCTVRGEHPAETLALVAFEHDLVAVGAPTASRAQGMMVGRTASALIHRAPRSLLLARRPPAAAPFLRTILLATDGSLEAQTAAGVAERLAVAHGSNVAIAAPMTTDPHRRHVVARDAASIMAATGTEPVFVDEDGPPHKAICDAAGRCAASLIVIGSRSLRSVAALRSVSERVAHGAPCSVLIVRAPV